MIRTRVLSGVALLSVALLGCQTTPTPVPGPDARFAELKMTLDC